MKYNLYQKVKISLDSDYRKQGIDKYGIQMEGIIIELEWSLPYQYKVKWSDGIIYNYRYKDLLPYNTEPNYEIY